MARSWSVPTGERTVHVVGDIHFCFRTWGGFNNPAGSVISGLWQNRWQKLLSDLSNGAVPTPACRVCIGDITDNGGTDASPYNTAGNQDALAIQQLARLPQTRTYPSQVALTPTVEMIGGNHDVAYPSGTPRGETAFEAAYGIPQSGGLGHYYVDLGFVRLLLLQQPRSSGLNTGTLDAADFNWLNAALTAAGSQECWIFYHYPPLNTVGGIQSGLAADQNVYSSFAPDGTSGFAFADPAASLGVDTQTLAMLGTHPNAKAWVSGHTHSPLEAPGLVTSATVGGHVIAMINVSAIYYTRRTVNPYDPIKSLYLTKPATGANRIEVRFRNHAAGVWDCPGTPGASKVATVTL